MCHDVSSAVLELLHEDGGAENMREEKDTICRFLSGTHKKVTQ
jgi:hypothetical protein